MDLKTLHKRVKVGSSGALLIVVKIAHSYETHPSFHQIVEAQDNYLLWEVLKVYKTLNKNMFPIFEYCLSKIVSYGFYQCLRALRQFDIKTLSMFELQLKSLYDTNSNDPDCVIAYYQVLQQQPLSAKNTSHQAQLYRVMAQGRKLSIDYFELSFIKDLYGGEGTFEGAFNSAKALYLSGYRSITAAKSIGQFLTSIIFFALDAPNALQSYLLLSKAGWVTSATTALVDTIQSLLNESIKEKSIVAPQIWQFTFKHASPAYQLQHALARIWLNLKIIGVHHNDFSVCGIPLAPIGYPYPYALEIILHYVRQALIAKPKLHAHIDWHQIFQQMNWFNGASQAFKSQSAVSESPLALIKRLGAISIGSTTRRGQSGHVTALTFAWFAGHYLVYKANKGEGIEKPCIEVFLIQNEHPLMSLQSLMAIVQQCADPSYLNGYKESSLLCEMDLKSLAELPISNQKSEDCSKLAVLQNLKCLIIHMNVLLQWRARIKPCTNVALDWYCKSLKKIANLAKKLAYHPMRHQLRVEAIKDTQQHQLQQQVAFTKEEYTHIANSIKQYAQLKYPGRLFPWSRAKCEKTAIIQRLTLPSI